MLCKINNVSVDKAIYVKYAYIRVNNSLTIHKIIAK